MTNPALVPATLLTLVLAGPVGCASSTTAGPPAPTCRVGLVESCPCPGALTGQRACLAPGSWGACACPQPVDAAVPRCGDDVCSPGEGCAACATDCGACPTCDAAPSCSGAVAVPSRPLYRPDLCLGDHAAGEGPDGGVASKGGCGPSKLRLRLAAIREDGGSEVTYCIVRASDGTRSSLAVTPKSSDPGDGGTFHWDPGEGTFWGQLDLLPTTSNLTVTYDCFAVNGDAFARVIKAAADAAAAVGGVAGAYGWAFGAGALAADVAAAAIEAASGDDHRLNAQQTLAVDDMLDLTNGRTWTIQQRGQRPILYHWNWTLIVEAWGCADARLGAG